MIKYVLGFALASVLLFGSCKAVGDLFGEGTVFTTADQLVEGEEGTIIPFDQLPDSVKAKIPEGTSLVMANRDQLVVDAAFVPAGGELDQGAIGGMIDAGFGIAKTFIPGLAAWEGVVTLLSRRKRKHYVKAAKALIPTDKNMDFGGALAGVTAALGITHSSKDTEAVFDEEEEV